ncbi:sulfatase-like hydrolase/transferase [Lacinutrix salivirga]
MFTTLQLTSLYIVKSFVDYSFIIHFNTRDVSAMLGLFKNKIFFFVLVLVLLFLLFFYAKQLVLKVIKIIPFIKSSKSTSTLKILKVVVLLLALFVMSSKHGVIQKSYQLASSLKVDNKPFKEQLKTLGMADYVLPEHIEVSGTGKNVIIISLESFEKGYLSDKYAELTPYLRSLKTNESWHYFNMNQNEGSQWTSGSMYTYLTGFPAYFGTMHNTIFQSSYHSNITGITHVLNKQNYKTTYIGDNAEVSGTKDMLYALKVNNIIDRNSINQATQDKDLFEIAKKEVLINTKKKQPFALFISTLSTHFPDGIYDKRMEEVITPKNSDIEFMAAATDYMIKDFIGYLKSINALKNTVVYIFPDHLKMGDAKLFENTGDRGLYVLTNAKQNTISYPKDQTIYQIDLPKLILEGAEIKHNVTFLTHYISGDKNEFIKNHISELTALNVTGFSRSELKPYIIPKISKEFEAYKTDTLRYIAHAGGKIDDHIYTNSLEALDLNYAKGFRLFELDIIKTSDNKFVAAHYWEDWQKMSGYTKTVPVSHQEFMSYKLYNTYTPLDMKAINQWFATHTDAILVTDKINEPKAFAQHFIAPKRLIMELFTWEAVVEAKENNITAMPSQRVLFNIEDNKIETLKKHNIKHIALSRNIIASNIDLLKALKRNDIKVYAYNVNEYIDRDEMYVVKHEMDYIYGIYADDWEF